MSAAEGRRSPPIPFELRWAPMSRSPRKWSAVREPCIGVALAKQSYAAPNGKLRFQEGDMLTIHKREDDGSCIAVNASGAGLVPEHLLEIRFMLHPEITSSTEPTMHPSNTAAEDKLATEACRKINLHELSLDDFTNERSLYQLLEPPSAGELAPAALVRGEWLLQRAAAMRAVDRASRVQLQLPRRQDLERDEPEAYIDASELKELPCGDRNIGFARPIICVSHCWRGKDHPDPHGDNLLALADAIEERIARGEAPEKFAVFLDWCSLHQRGEGGAPRSEVEIRAFSMAISRMQLWYAHQKTLVYLLTATPKVWLESANPAETAPVPYEGRGWPCFERMVTMLIKLQSSKSWSTIVDVGEPQRKVQPPKTLEGFEQLVRTRTFTNGADIDVVIALYRETLSSALGQVTSLRYTGLHWGDAEMAELVQVLPWCERLEGLNLKGAHNGYTEESARMLAEALANPSFLPQLHLLGVGCRVQGAAQEPLQHDPRLRATCKDRGIKLDRDVPIDAALHDQEASQHQRVKTRRSSSIQSDALTMRRRGRVHGQKTLNDLRKAIAAHEGNDDEEEDGEEEEEEEDESEESEEEESDEEDEAQPKLGKASKHTRCHKADLLALQKRDPAFFEYMRTVDEEDEEDEDEDEEDSSKR